LKNRQGGASLSANKKKTLTELKSSLTFSSRQSLISALHVTSSPGPRIIAEVKRKSPSQGVLYEAADPVHIALSYQKAGAAAVSVLTENDYFGGHLNDLLHVRRQAPSLAILQKDFVVDPYQIYEAHSFGADAILLILSLIGESTAREFHGIATSLGLNVLVEVHNEAELNAAVRIGALIIGVNNRDLKSLSVSLDVSRALAPLIPRGLTCISESGIETPTQISELRKLGYHGFLIGTHLMTKADPGQALANLIGGRQV